MMPPGFSERLASSKNSREYTTLAPIFRQHRQCKHPNDHLSDCIEQKRTSRAQRHAASQDRAQSETGHVGGKDDPERI